MTLRAAVELALAALAHAPTPGVGRARALQVGQAVLKAGKGEGWAEDDPQLEAIEGELTTDLIEAWFALELRLLDLVLPRVVSSPLGNGTLGYRIDALPILADMLADEALFIQKYGAAEGPLVRRQFAAFIRGLENARKGLDPGVPFLDDVAQAAYRDSLVKRGMSLVQNITVRRYREPIVKALVSGEFDGMNPTEVARKLKQRFDAGDYDWERLATTEIAMAQSDGKLAQYKAAGITHVDYLTAEDSRVSKICRSLAANGPYPVDSAPVPGRDSHPGCRCTLMAAPEDPKEPVD